VWEDMVTGAHYACLEMGGTPRFNVRNAPRPPTSQTPRSPNSQTPRPPTTTATPGSKRTQLAHTGTTYRPSTVDMLPNIAKSSPRQPKLKGSLRPYTTPVFTTSKSLPERQAPSYAAPMWLGASLFAPSMEGSSHYEAEIPELEMRIRQAEATDISEEIRCAFALTLRYNTIVAARLAQREGSESTAETMRMVKRAEALVELPCAIAARRMDRNAAHECTLTWLLCSTAMRQRGNHHESKRYASKAAKAAGSAKDMLGVALVNLSCAEVDQGHWGLALNIALKAIEVLAFMGENHHDNVAVRRCLYCKSAAHHNAATALCGLEAEAVDQGDALRASAYHNAAKAHRADAADTAYGLGEKHRLFQRMSTARSLALRQPDA